MTMVADVILLPPNRVWRSYQGGSLLDEIQGVPSPADAHFPEDWIGSTTRAVNTGREHVIEGISRITMADGSIARLDELVAAHRDAFLGCATPGPGGSLLQPLVKYLDSATRLHFQAHPTREFSLRHFGVYAGKTEAYHILKIRGDQPAPCIYLGFQRMPGRAELRRIIVEQDIPALETCFEPIPVAVGDTFIVPGGLPHAIGPGVLMLEVMEPTDFVARIEFSRDGYTLPEPARFMGRDVDFALDMMDLSQTPLADVIRRCRAVPEPITTSRKQLIGPRQTPCFRVESLTVNSTEQLAMDTFAIGIVKRGPVKIRSASGHTRELQTWEKFLVPAAAWPLEFAASNAELLFALPPIRDAA